MVKNKGSLESGKQGGRNRVVLKIESLQKKFKSFSRSCFCHAISILDLFELRKKQKFEEMTKHCSTQYILAFTCLVLAHKYLNTQKINLEAFLIQIYEKQEVSLIKLKVLETEEIILNGIDYQLPCVNAYEILDSCVAKESQVSQADRKMALVSLKILMVGFKISSVLSLHPELSKEIHTITMSSGKKLDASPQALQIYQQVLQYLSNSHTN